MYPNAWTLLAATIALTVTFIIAKRVNRRQAYLGRRNRLALLAGVLAGPFLLGLLALGEFAYSRNVWIWWLPQGILSGYWMSMLPLVWGILAIGVWLVAMRRSPISVEADLAPRTLLTFAPRKGIWLTAGLFTAITLVSIVAGLHSTTNRDGNFMHYELVVYGVARTHIYGWYYSVPNLVLLTLLLGLALLALSRIARPAIQTNRSEDVGTRRAMSFLVVTTVISALGFHAAHVLKFAAGTASLRAGAEIDGQQIEIWGPFAALAPILLIAGYLCEAIGFGAWGYLLWRGVLPKHVGEPRTIDTEGRR